MIAVDTNILVYAHREDSEFHKRADEILTDLANGHQTWAIPWPCIHEFLGIVTYPKIFKMTTPLDLALEEVECWMECPYLSLIGEEKDYWPVLKSVLRSGKIVGPKIHDAKIAAICVQNNVKVFWSADRDFSRMQGLKVENPLL